MIQYIIVAKINLFFDTSKFSAEKVCVIPIFTHTRARMTGPTRRDLTIMGTTIMGTGS